MKKGGNFLFEENEAKYSHPQVHITCQIQVLHYLSLKFKHVWLIAVAMPAAATGQKPTDVSKYQDGCQNVQQSNNVVALFRLSNDLK